MTRVDSLRLCGQDGVIRTFAPLHTILAVDALLWLSYVGLTS